MPHVSSDAFSEISYKLLVQGVADYAIYLLHPDGTVANWNLGAERAKGYTAGEIVGKHFSLFYTPQDRAAGLPQRGLDIALREGRFEAEGWRLRKDGGRFWAHVVIDPIYRQEGGLLGFAKITRDRTEHNENLQKIAHMARHDVLTGLPNRLQFIARLDAGLADADKTRHRVAAVVIDLDRFKEINDAFGHAVGDEVLCALADRMKALIGEGECVARFGGDEFVALKIFADDADLREFTAKLRRALTAPIALKHGDIEPGASLGVALYPTDAGQRDRLLNNADLAMYRAKESFENKICFYEAAMDEVPRARRAMGRDLWRGIEEQQFFLDYQPQYSVKTKAVRGYEALLRWRHPVLGLVAPLVFIPIAEECGAINRLGDWVLETACREAAKLPSPYKIAVNLSPLQLRSVGLVDKLRSILVRTGLAANRLELELTESAIVADQSRALHTLRQIKAMGVSIAIDDFGTGYSSLAMLRAFPFDRIKLDQSLVSDIATSGRAKTFMRAILALGRSLDIAVLAEGVETAQQMAVLESEGYDEAQGFLLGRPGGLEGAMPGARGLRAVEGLQSV